MLKLFIGALALKVGGTYFLCRDYYFSAVQFHFWVGCFKTNRTWQTSDRVKIAKFCSGLPWLWPAGSIVPPKTHQGLDKGPLMFGGTFGGSIALIVRNICLFQRLVPAYTIYGITMTYTDRTTVTANISSSVNNVTQPPDHQKSSTLIGLLTHN